MFKSSLLLLTLLATASVMVLAEPDKPWDNVIDLDLPPEERWVPAMKALFSKQGWEHTYKPVMDFIDNYSPYAKPVIDALDPILASLAPQFGEYGKELQGIYSVVNSMFPGKMTFGRLVLLNTFYDITAGCTSVVASSTDPTYCATGSSSKLPFSLNRDDDAAPQCAGPNGALIHGRNLDFPIPGLPNITSTVHFVKNGVAVVRGVTYLGYVGVLTGYRVGGWSVSVDERDKHHWVNTTIPIIDNILSVLMGGQSLGTHLRTSLMTIPTFSQAVASLNTTRLVAPVYLIVGGLRGDEGAIITRNREGTDFSGGAQSGVWGISTSRSEWFRAQTNDDHWLAPQDARRDTINKAMSSIGRGSLNTNSMLTAMHTPRILNAYTTFVSYMSPAYDLMYCEVVNRHSTKLNWDHFGGKNGIKKME